ncbi:MAG TPA: threonine/serine dehydratase [Asanoa sp.]
MTGVSVGPSTAAIADAERVIRSYVRTTPVVVVDRAEFGLTPGRLVLKLEHLQHAGSFKARGAFANLLLRQVPAAGVAAASGGNHGAAVAYAASVLGMPAHIFVPSVSSPAKIARIRGYGAELIVGGDSYEDALAASEAFLESSGALPVHAFDQVETMLGTGTIALELRRAVDGPVTVLAAVGGGGLISGLAAGWAGFCAGPVVGVEPATAPTLTAALRAGRPVDAPVGGIAIDSLAPRRIGEVVFPVIAAHVSRTVLVSDEHIRAAQRALWDTLRLVVEPGGGTAFAALLSGAYEPATGESVAVVLSGANTTAVDFSR